MKEPLKIYLVANAKTRRVVAWNARQDERDGLLTQLNRCATQQYVAGVVTLDPEITTGGSVAQFFEPEDLTVPEQFRAEFDAAVDKIVERFADKVLRDNVMIVSGTFPR